MAAIAADPKRAAPIMAAIQAASTPALIDQVAEEGVASRARPAGFGAVRAP